MSQKGEIAAEGMVEGAYTALLDYPILLDDSDIIIEKGKCRTLETYPGKEEYLQAAYFIGFTAGYRWIVERVQEDEEEIQNLSGIITSSTRAGTLRLIKAHFDYFYSDSSFEEELEKSTRCI
jgi:hypothetical protein